jgi:hypothetical protein
MSAPTAARTCDWCGRRYDGEFCPRDECSLPTAFGDGWLFVAGLAIAAFAGIYFIIHVASAAFYQGGTP